LKEFYFEGRRLKIAPPTDITFEHLTSQKMYSDIYSEIDPSKPFPHIDADTLVSKGYFASYRLEGIKLPDPTKSNPNPDRSRNQTALEKFFETYPILITFIQNCKLKAALQLKHAEELVGSSCTIDNFMDFKRICNQFYKMNWKREQDISESQASTSNLGTLSESLLNHAFASILKENVFMKVEKTDTKSYGDFVVSALPNNLWLSVKSSYGRERLLASGFSNDILGVGFFEEVKEFTSLVKIRHYQRAGFLAIYLPDEPVTIEQIDEGINTYGSVEKHYADSGKALPSNINGNPFIRPLSQLPHDLEPIIKHDSLVDRTTVKF